MAEQHATSVIAKVPLVVWALVVPVIAAVAVVVTGPTWSAPAPVSTPASEVRIQNFAFSPNQVTVAPGAKVLVVNMDSTTHTMSADGHQFDTRNLGSGKRATITAPTTPGTYKFMCQIHPNMTGTLVVKGS